MRSNQSLSSLAASQPLFRAVISGFALVTPLGNDPDTIWTNAKDGRSGISTLKLFRDYPQDCLQPPFRVGSNIYCNAYGACELDIKREDVHLPPHVFRTLSESTRLTLWLAERAVADSGLLAAGYAPERIGVFISQNSGETAHVQWDENIVLRADMLLDIVDGQSPLTPQLRTAIRETLLDGRVTPNADTMLGRLNCAAAGYICRRFHFAGPSHSVGAACASGMAALYDALCMLQAGVIDAAVVGGGEEAENYLAKVEFCSMMALAKSEQYGDPSRCSRPFDAKRSGFVPSQGGAMFVLEREDTAHKRSAPCLGLLTGMGAATNYQDLVEPSADVQLAAIRASFQNLDYGPADVDLVECHATSTPSGDREEAKALAAIYGAAGGVHLCALKSQIGHTVGASGLIALGHGLLAMRDKTLPPTINHEHPDPDCNLAGSGLRLLDKAVHWDAPVSGIRRMQVNAFGFGGACYVAQIEEPNTRRTGGAQNAAFTASLLTAAATPPPIAVMFCGQGAVYQGMGRELYDAVPLVREGMERIAACADWDMLALMDEKDKARLVSTRWQQPYLLMLEYGIFHYLKTLGLNTALCCGHSLGELIALCAAGAYSPETAYALINQRASNANDLEKSAARRTGMMAVHAPLQIIEETIHPWPDIAFCNFNAPTQYVLAGPADELAELGAVFRKKRVPSVRLGVSLAFHYKDMHAARNKNAADLALLPMSAPLVPILSNITTLPYPNDPDGIRTHILDLDENAVQWIACVERVRKEYSINHFVEIGPGSVLSDLVQEIVPDAVCLPTCRKGKEVEFLHATVDRLTALGCLQGAGAVQTGISAPVAAHQTPALEVDDEPAVMMGEREESILDALAQATGFARAEIAPSMLLKEDLGLRSIHFPMLVQNLFEKTGLKVDLEQLVGATTVHDLICALQGAVSDVNSLQADADTHEKAVLRYVPEWTELSGQGVNDEAVRMPQMRGEASLILHISRENGETFVPKRFMEQCLSITEQLRRHLVRYPDGTCLIIMEAAKAELFDWSLFEALSAVALTARQEYPKAYVGSVCQIGEAVSDEMAHSVWFNTNAPWPRMIRAGGAFVPRLRQAGLTAEKTALPAQPGDVIVVSGGAGGIVPFALRDLAALPVRLALFGRSPLEDVSSKLHSKVWNAVREQGTDVEYFCCDISDSFAVAQTMNTVRKRYGRVDGVFHAAAIDCPATLAEMDMKDFERVLSVKCLGLHTLLTECAPRYALAFSSHAAWFGNYGQTAYAAANRAMSGILEASGLPCKTIWLPPVRGAGMADNENTRAAMRLKNMDQAWIEAQQLGELVIREIFQSGQGQTLFAKYLPEVPGHAPAVLIDGCEQSTPYAPPAIRRHSCRPVYIRELPEPVFETEIAFSRFNDLWIADHLPLPDMEHPFLSGVMEVEYLISSARQMMPWRTVPGLKDVHFITPVACPEGITREGRVSIRRGAENTFQASFTIRNMTANWRRTKSWSECARAQVITSLKAEPLEPLWTWADITPDTVYSSDEMTALYSRRTGLKNRYRLLHHVSVTNEGKARAKMLYPTEPDYRDPGRGPNAYPVYALEAALHCTRPTNERMGIFVGVQELRLGENCAPGEELRVEAQILDSSDAYVHADAQVLNLSGQVCLAARGITCAFPESGKN